MSEVNAMGVVEADRKRAVGGARDSALGPGGGPAGEGRPALAVWGRMRPYRALAGTAARSLLAYPLNFLLGLFGVLFQLLAMLSIWGVLLRSGVSVAGFSWPEMKAYLLIAYGTAAMLSFNEFRLPHRIRDGTVSVDLTKPVDFQRARFAEALGGGVVESGFTVLVVALVLVATGGVPVPPLDRFALFLVSFLLVLPIKFCVSYLTAMVCFWTENVFGVNLARVAITSLFSGALVPLTMLPGWLYGLAMMLPFASITFTPALLYLGRATGEDAWRLLGIQAFWALALWWGSRLAWRTAVRKLTVHGG